MTLFEQHTFSHVIHLADHAGILKSNNHPQVVLSNNILDFDTLLRCFTDYRVNDVLFASSPSVYGNRSASVPFMETDKAGALTSVYVAYKKADELLAYLYSNFFGLSTTGLRLLAVYALVRTHMASYFFIAAIFHERPVLLYLEGNPVREFTYIEDAVRVTSMFLGHHENSPIPRLKLFNVGSGTAGLLVIIERLIGTPAKRIYQPTPASDFRTILACDNKLKHPLATTQNTPVEKGVYNTANWYMKYARRITHR
ncbi:MAG: NAD-dependent epimerase/dehydratase family protein [Flavobacteriales bacterium]|nr:NAD-dependent epimerase/dehydratase family protein [Flavobacteriales bacterium]MCB9205110.1 NAD-dependent epimerase/dehydratase family protein [Flavobacteriales bacterium]